jgi:hypothetical protein
MRTMIDATHSGLPAALGAIKALPAGNLVALYDTGSASIISTAIDRGEIPSQLHTVMIDQGFTGSPNLNANVRDVENGAWTVAKAVNRTGWNVPRPTLYVGFPNTVQEVAAAGWKGDVWLVHSGAAPTAPPTVPSGLNVVAVQFNFTNSAFDVSVVFDPNWPNKAPAPKTPPPPGQWRDPAEWTWKQVFTGGVGLDDRLHLFELDGTVWDRKAG